MSASVSYVDPIVQAAKKKKVQIAVAGIAVVILLAALAIGIYYLIMSLNKKKSGGTLPSGITEGKIYSCDMPFPRTYKIEGGKKRWYPTPEIYKSYGSPAASPVACTLLDSIVSGDDMPLKT